MSLFAELQRRSVFKVAAAYLVVGWLVIQVAATVAPQMGLPEWAPRFVTLIVLLGFPVALVLAWVFDVTPEGVRVDPAPSGNKRVFAVAAVLVAAALGWWWKAQPTAGGEAAGAEARSIAVLPFANMSGDPANEYFSDGISEEILNVLARTPELSVAARTSSFAYKGKTEDIPQIARELKVRMVLEGSVRKQGERVRITAQLIDSQSGFHVWSQTYDRDLKDIFAIQDEIAKAIGDELKLRIGGADASVSGTTDVEAHDLYLRGLTQWQVREEASLFAAIDAFERAAAIDPTFAEAYGGMAIAYAVLPAYSNRLSADEAFARALDAAQRALAIDPMLPEAYAAMGDVAGFEGRRGTGIALLRRAVALKPSWATAHQWLGTMLMENGEPDASIAELERAAALDPRALIVASNLASMYSIVGRDRDAIEACRPTLEYAPKAILCVSVMGLSHVLLGEVEQARPYYDLWAKNWGGGTEAQVAELFAALEGKADKRAFARKLAAYPQRSWRELGSGNLMSDFDTAVLLMLFGERELALDYIERSANGNQIDLTWAVQMPQMDPLRCEPRFQAVMKKLAIVDFRVGTLCAKQGGG